MNVVDQYPWNVFTEGFHEYFDFLKILEKTKTKLNEYANDCKVENCVWEISIYDKYHPSNHVMSWGFVDHKILSDPDFKIIEEKGNKFGFDVEIKL